MLRVLNETQEWAPTLASENQPPSVSVPVVQSPSAASSAPIAPLAEASAWWGGPDVWTSRRVAKVKRFCWTAFNVCAGSALAAGSAYAVAKTLAPPLLKLVDTAGGVRGIFRQMYVVGPLLSAVLGLGGVYGYIATALMLLTIVNTMVNSETQAQARGNWTLAHIATGFAMAPLLTLSLPLASTLGAGAIASSLHLGLSVLLSRRLNNDHPSWQGCIMSICMGVALAPLGAMAAMGLPTEELFTNAAFLVVAGASTIAILTGWFNYTKMASDSTTYLDKFKQPVPDDLRLPLPLPNRQAPNVSGCTQEVIDTVIACRAYIAAGDPIGKEKLLLSGNTEAARARVAYGIAAELNCMHIYAPQLVDLKAEKPAIVNVQQLFNEVACKSREDPTTPVVLYFTDAELLFADPGIQTGFLTCLDGAPRHRDDNLVIIASTNNPEKLKERILGRFMTRPYVTTPTLREFCVLFTTKWKDAIAASPFKKNHNLKPIPENDLTQLCKQAVNFNGLDDANIEMIVSGAIKKGVAYKVRSECTSGTLCAPHDIEQVMYAALHSNLEAACTLSLSPAVGTPFAKPTLQAMPQSTASDPGPANPGLSYAK